MKSIIWYAGIFFFIQFPIYSSPVSFSLSKSVVKKSEPFFAEIRVEGDKKIKADKKTFSLGGVEASYAGIVSETKILNFQVSKYAVLRFSIVHYLPGKFQVPPITVLVDGSRHTFPKEFFTVLDEEYSSRQQDPFKMRFHENFKIPSEKPEYWIRFQTNKTEVFVGEPIIGYFILFSSSPHIPVFERNPNESISFPFFTSELLTGVQISLPGDVDLERNGKVKKYFTKAYPREIFALIPLRDGEFQVGATKFDILNSQFFHWGSESLDVERQKLIVNPLPKPSPKYFSGEVGQYKSKLEYSGDSTEEGNPFRLKLTIKGKGLCNRWKDPILQQIPNSFPGKIVSTGVDRERKFTEWEDSIFGFECSANFHYAVQLSESSSSFPVEISYFDPDESVFRKQSLEFPAIKKLPRNNSSNDSYVDYSNDVLSVSWITVGYYLVGGLFGFFLGYLIYKNYLLPAIGRKKYLKNVDNLAGSKVGLILERALEKELSNTEAKFFRTIKDKYPHHTFSHVYGILDYKERQELEEIIFKGEKEI